MDKLMRLAAAQVIGAMMREYAYSPITLEPKIEPHDFHVRRYRMYERANLLIAQTAWERQRHKAKIDAAEAKRVRKNAARLKGRRE